MRHYPLTRRVDPHFVFERIREGPDIVMGYVNTKKQLADMLTKGPCVQATWLFVCGLLRIGLPISTMSNNKVPVSAMLPNTSNNKGPVSTIWSNTSNIANKSDTQNKAGGATVLSKVVKPTSILKFKVSRNNLPRRS